MPQAFPPSFAHGGKVGVCFEAAAMIIVLVLLGQVLELRARNKTGNAIRALMGLATPMSVMVGVGRGAQAGVLIRDAEAIEMMRKVTTVVVDETGTLT